MTAQLSSNSKIKKSKLTPGFFVCFCPFQDYLLAEWSGEGSLQAVLGTLRHHVTSPLALFDKLPAQTGQPHLQVAGNSLQNEKENASKQEQLHIDPTSYANVSASGGLPPVPDEVKRKVTFLKF